ncbi:substrate-binding domain-containing protein [Micromonospora sp. NPDC049559]|uniref:vWA domain-containing protein n=1 Tax=Micromonospora sp. NPDC049559 TaxID=3155923 RepID=UPI0034184CA7
MSDVEPPPDAVTPPDRRPARTPPRTAPPHAAPPHAAPAASPSAASPATGSPPSPEADGPLWQELLRSLTGAVAVTVGALSTGWPENPFQWLLLAVAALLGGVAPHTQASDYVRVRLARALHRLRPSRPLRLRRLLLIVVAVLLAASFGRSLVTGGARLTEWGSVRVFGCAAPTSLRVLTTPEELEPTRRLAETYERATAAGRYGCPTVELYVYAAPADSAREALASGWQANALAEFGPRPDLWLPGSSRYTIDSPQAPLTGVSTVSLASTPIVLALPAEAVPEELRARRAALTWADALAELAGRGWEVARPDPVRSTTGEYATVAMYASGGGLAQRLAGPGPQYNLVTPARARLIEGQVARGLDAGGYPLGDAVELLCRQRQREGRGAGRPPDGALVVTEEQLIRFNAGWSLGPACPPGPEAAPDRKLYAVYPIDTLSLDHPLVEPVWADRSTDQAGRVGEFRRWLRTDPGKRSLNELGLRPRDRPAADPIGDRFGVQPGVRYPDLTPAPAALDAARELQRSAQRSGRVLVLLDASGSMRQPAAEGLTRIDVAKRGVATIVRGLGGQDEFGLWTFQGPTRTPRRLLPIAPAEPVPAGALPRPVEAALAGVRPDGGTPLYRAVVDGIGAVEPADDRHLSALVVLTDGVDEGSGVSGEQLVARAEAGGVRVFVLAVGEASCAAGPLREAVTVSGGACYETGFASLDRRLNELFGVLWGGGGAR